jgi:hypothetical protein
MGVFRPRGWERMSVNVKSELRETSSHSITADPDLTMSNTFRHYLEVEIVVYPDIKVQAPQCHPQVVPVRVCAVPHLEPKPLVKVHVVKYERDAAAPVVHVVDLRVPLHGHADGNGSRRLGGDALAEAAGPSVSLVRNRLWWRAVAWNSPRVHYLRMSQRKKRCGDKIVLSIDS